jgi:NAD(P)-dependent dehydrogenase (short-subunit alcohol dehydrogenase family)
MTQSNFKSALIVGAGAGLSASLARLLTREGLAVALAARDPAKLASLCNETGARAFACDAQHEADVRRLFAEVDRAQGAPDVVIYNPSARTRGPFVELVPAEVQRAIQVTAFGAFLVAQQAAIRMLPKGHGAILFTGASASVKDALSAPFAMAKSALRGLAQSLARELCRGDPRGALVIDGGFASRTPTIRSIPMLLDPTPSLSASPCSPPTAQCVDLEVELRPWLERFGALRRERISYRPEATANALPNSQAGRIPRKRGAARTRSFPTAPRASRPARRDPGHASSVALAFGSTLAGAQGAPGNPETPG